MRVLIIFHKCQPSGPIFHAKFGIFAEHVLFFLATKMNVWIKLGMHRRHIGLVCSVMFEELAKVIWSVFVI